MKHSIKLFIFTIGCFVLTGGLLSAQNATNTITVSSIKGPSGIAMIRLFDVPPAVNGFSLNVEALGDASLAAAKLIKGEAQIGVLPANVAAKIAASGQNIRIAAVTGTGMLSLLSANSRLKAIENLKGTTVAVAGQGATPDYVFRTILDAHGLVPAGPNTPASAVNLRFSLKPAEIASALIAGRLQTGLLPEPFATMALAGNKKLHKVADIQAEWTAATGQATYPMTVIAVSGAFADAHPAALAMILGAIKDSVAWTVANPVKAGVLVEKYKLGLKAKVAEAAIPVSAYTYQTAQEAKPALEALFKVFLKEHPASIGGKMPADEFYCK